MTQKSKYSLALITLFTLQIPHETKALDNHEKGLIGLAIAGVTALGYFGITKYSRWSDESTIRELETLSNNIEYNYKSERDLLTPKADRPDGYEAQLDKLSPVIIKGSSDDSVIQRYQNELTSTFLKAKNSQQELAKKLVKWQSDSSRRDLYQAAERLNKIFSELTDSLSRLDNIMRLHTAYFELSHQYNLQGSSYNKDIISQNAKELEPVILRKFSDANKHLYPYVLYGAQLSDDMRRLQKPLQRYATDNSFKLLQNAKILNAELERINQVLVETSAYQTQRVEAADHAFKEREIIAKEREAKAAEDKVNALRAQAHAQERLALETRRKADLIEAYRRVLETFNKNVERLLRHPDFIDSSARQTIGSLHSQIQELKWRS